jgi:hypothetical protein
MLTVDETYLDICDMVNCQIIVTGLALLLLLFPEADLTKLVIQFNSINASTANRYRDNNSSINITNKLLTTFYYKGQETFFP